MADQALVKIADKIAREMTAIVKGQANKVYPGSRLAESIQIYPEFRGEADLRMRVSMVPYGTYQNRGTYERGKAARGRTGPFNPKPARRGDRKTWNPTGIEPSFFTSIGSQSVRLVQLYRQAVREYAKSMLPFRINLTLK